jgi:hypothetical protein
MSGHILVTTNNFWVGGRETYLETYLRAALLDGWSADLLCNDCQEIPPARVFSQIERCGSGDAVTRLRAWMERGAALIGARRPTLIWAHHFDLLPAWVLSRLHRVPLLTTFHGPLTGSARPNDLLQAFGMLTVIRRGEGVSGVSQEVVQQLAALGATDPVLLPNVVASLDSASAPPRWPPRTLLLVTRSDKLGHIRASLRLFAAYRRYQPRARLEIACGVTPADSAPGTSLLSQMAHGLRVLGARWCREQGPLIWRALPWVTWLGYTDDARGAARRVDVVLGMGRVVLEALAENRPAVLVGYAEAHGLLTPERWGRAAATNFSGRGCEVVRPESMARELLAIRPPTRDVRFSELDSRRWAQALRTMSVGLSLAPAPGDLELAEELASVARGPTAEDAALFRVAACHLASGEWEPLYRLVAG